MSLIDEYGDRREKRALKEVFVSMLEYGDSFQEISDSTNYSVDEIMSIVCDDSI